MVYLNSVIEGLFVIILGLCLYGALCAPYEYHTYKKKGNKTLAFLWILSYTVTISLAILVIYYWVGVYN